MARHYPEIEALNQLWVKHRVMIKITREDHLAGWVDRGCCSPAHGGSADLGKWCAAPGKLYKLFIDDEYDDLRYNYPLLNFCLVLRELEGFDLARDPRIWAQERGLDPEHEQVRDYHKYLSIIYPEIEKILVNIHPQVSDWDFEMNAGAAQQLRRSN